MKVKKPYYFIGYFLMISSLFSCVQLTDFEIPELEITEPQIIATSDIRAVKNASNQADQKIYTFKADDTSVIEAYVVSSDEGGNFYKKMIIQDKNENPTSGIEVLIDLRAYFTKFNFGRKIYIKMAGLSVTNDDGKYILGYNMRNEVEGIPEYLIDDFIIRSGTTESIISKPITLADITHELIGLYVQVNDIQFRNDEIGKTYAGESYDEFDGERVLVQCDSRISAILSTSTFSDFKSNLIPVQKGELQAVLTKDFYSEKYIFVLNNLSSVTFEDEDRCDPEFLNCEGDIFNSRQIIFYEDFENINKTKDLEELGWTNINTNLGKEKFKKSSLDGNNYMRISAYNSEENPLEAWLITPAINLDNSRDEILTFDTKASYDNGTILTAWVSTDFSVKIEEATWQQLNVEISVGPSSTYGKDYISSGIISLSCLSGKATIALRYLGGDPGTSTTYDIDNFKILGK